jgi:hypothetical protein
MAIGERLARVDQFEQSVRSAGKWSTALGSLDVTNGFSSGSRFQLLFPWICLFTAWAVAIAAGVVILQAYAASPGASGRAVPDWPQDSGIPLDGRRPTLLLFLHPACPCSRASVDELDELLRLCRDRVRAYVVCLRSPSLDGQGEHALDRLSGTGEGITFRDDDGGVLARRFGVLTSGHVLLYDAHGRLLFNGGITPARGHGGDNLGRSAVVAGILGARLERATAPVFGCPLFEPGAAERMEVRP